MEAARHAAVSSVTRQRSVLDPAAAAPECRDGSDEPRPGTRVAAAGRLVGLSLATATTYDRGEQMGATHLRSAGAGRQPTSPTVCAPDWQAVLHTLPLCRLEGIIPVSITQAHQIICEAEASP